MDYREVSGDREFLLSLSYGADWHEEIESFAAENDVAAAWFAGTGAVETAELGWYDQDDFRYETVSFEEPLEVTACVGSIAEGEDEEPLADAHVTLSRPSGQALSGRLHRARVFAGDLYVRTFEDPLAWDRDEATGRDRWGV